MQRLGALLLFDLSVAQLKFPKQLLKMQLGLYLSALAATTSAAASGAPQQVVFLKSSSSVYKHT